MCEVLTDRFMNDIVLKYYTLTPSDKLKYLLLDNFKYIVYDRPIDTKVLTDLLGQLICEPDVNDPTIKVGIDNNGAYLYIDSSRIFSRHALHNMLLEIRWYMMAFPDEKINVRCECNDLYDFDIHWQLTISDVNNHIRCIEQAELAYRDNYGKLNK